MIISSVIQLGVRLLPCMTVLALHCNLLGLSDIYFCCFPNPTYYLAGDLPSYNVLVCKDDDVNSDAGSRCTHWITRAGTHDWYSHRCVHKHKPNICTWYLLHTSTIYYVLSNIMCGNVDINYTGTKAYIYYKTSISFTTYSGYALFKEIAVQSRLNRNLYLHN